MSLSSASEVAPACLPRRLLYTGTIHRDYLGEGCGGGFVVLNVKVQRKRILFHPDIEHMDILENKLSRMDAEFYNSL